MQFHLESSDPAAIEFRATLGALGLAQQRVAEMFWCGAAEYSSLATG
jgi:hypothetical protein